MTEITHNDCQREHIDENEAFTIAYTLGREDYKKRIAAELSALREQVKEAREILGILLESEGTDATDQYRNFCIARVRARAWLTKTEPKE